MAPLSLFFLFLFFLQNPFSSNAIDQKSSLFRSLDLSQQHSKLNQKPNSTIRFFEVAAPIKVPSTKPCSVLVLQHDFGNTYSKPPVTAHYKPPTHCSSQIFSKIILRWSATCKGRQFDRIFGIWLGGVELFRSCTAEPTASGIVWTVEKDVTRYSSLFKNPQTLSVYLANIVDKTYTGIYHVDVWFDFYPGEETREGSTANSAYSASGFNSSADLILPISRNPPNNDALWFVINNNTDFQTKEFEIPRNAYRAVLEVLVSFHGDDEFWYGNPPEDYLIANNITGMAGNGPFREVIVSLDDKLVGAVWPFTVIYTGGVNPLLWRPITGIGSFDLPSYNIDISAFLGLILDGKSHQFGFAVANSLDMWYVDANLHLWLDRKSEKTVGKLISHTSQPTKLCLASKFGGLDGSFSTKATRLMISHGWVKTSNGKINVHSEQRFVYENRMVFKEDGNLQVVKQTIETNNGVNFVHQSSLVYATDTFHRFPLYIYMRNVDQGNGSFSSSSNISMGFIEGKISSWESHVSVSSLSNSQNGQGEMVVKQNLVQSGLGSTQQKYSYESEDLCYYRDVSSRNYTILHDKWSEKCRIRSKLGSVRQLPSAAWEIFRSSDMKKQGGGN